MIIKQADLTSVISEVIENLAMMVVEPPESTADFHPQLHGWIEFTGPVTGKLSIRCTESLAQAVAANLLGTENMDLRTQANAWDALAELLNVICGNLITELIDSDRPFTLSVPQINIIQPHISNDNSTETEYSEPLMDDKSQTAILLLDGQLAEFRFIVNEAEQNN
jgi:CheY-specific phosphatase CheX